MLAHGIHVSSRFLKGKAAQSEAAEAGTSNASPNAMGGETKT
jgi:hypothetical protein